MDLDKIINNNDLVHESIQQYYAWLHLNIRMHYSTNRDTCVRYISLWWWCGENVFTYRYSSEKYTVLFTVEIIYYGKKREKEEKSGRSYHFETHSFLLTPYLAWLEVRTVLAINYLIVWHCVNTLPRGRCGKCKRLITDHWSCWSGKRLITDQVKDWLLTTDQG